ncbi:MAG: tRNA uridine-5-carboxymethylaminomethyl(34) synthesis GTPase MnmE [Eubacteriales bacterium]
MFIKETIAAIATPMSSSGIGIIRISGENALDIVDKIYLSKNRNKIISQQKSHTIHYGFIVDNEEVIDEVLVSIMRGPNSYTGEDTIEVNCHGGIFVMQKVLQLITKCGARPAEPGEFTKRAFLNGKMDLSQAEAVMDVIDSKNNYALQSSMSQLKGNVQSKINEVRETIIYHTAFIETALDDPEHISIDGYSDELKVVTLEMVSKLKRLLDTADDGRIIKEGIQTVIVGKPNAGKSSLLNILVGVDRAIVTDIAGTTRDILEESINLNGITLNIVDTAGIRDTADIVEKMGVDRAKQYANKADLLMFVVDSSRELDENDKQIFDIIEDKKAVILLNKTDLEQVISIDNLEQLGVPKHVPVIPISAKNNIGIKDLENKVKEMFFHGELDFNDEIYITNMRHKVALQSAYDSLNKVLESIELGLPEDFYSIDLLDAYEALGTIIGETIGEDLVNEIFSKFCMGK